MAFRAERTQKQGRERHPHPLLRRAHGDKGGHNNSVPDDGVAAVHRAYGAQYPEIRFRQGQESVRHGFEGHLPCPERRKGIGGTGESDGEMDHAHPELGAGLWGAVNHV